MSNKTIETIVRVFNERGSGRYGDECVSQLEHAIQAALLAQASDAKPSLVVAALLHDIGHILGDSEMPEDNEQDLNDFHEEKAYPWLLHRFGQSVADPVRLHVAAKRYLCTKEPEYIHHLSPTSAKSFYDQGGVMTPAELAEFESEIFYRDALALRRWDDLAKEEKKAIPPIESFVPLLQDCIEKTAA